MISFTNTIRIDRPVDEVYAYLSDLEHTPEWNWAITETVKATPGPIGVGTRYRQTRSVPQPATEMLEITALKANRHIEVRGTLARFPASLTYRLDRRIGGTELTNTVDLEANGPLRLIESALGSRIKRAVADNLSQLKNLLEAREDGHETTRPDVAAESSFGLLS